MERKKIITVLPGLVFAVVAAIGLIGWQSEHQRASLLEEQIAELQKQEKQSAVVRSVSKQMEEIAYQQKEISDEQRIEAQQQTMLANEERQKAETSEKMARASEQRAIASEKQAQDARLQAEDQRLQAEQQRQQAIQAKSYTDTLRYQVLGRSLGSLSLAQAQSGNEELAELLAYASYHYTQRYQGDVYNPAVLQALTEASKSIHHWSVSNGAITCIDFMQKSNHHLVTVSNYGEIIRHEKVGNELKSTVLLRDSRYDFRYVQTDEEGSIYAISRFGQFVKIPQNGLMQEATLTGVNHPTDIQLLGDDVYVVMGERSYCFFDKHNFKQLGVCQLDHQISAVGRINSHPMYFDDKGNMHEVISLHETKSTKVPFKGHVTAFAESKNTHTTAYGMSDGSIYVSNPSGTRKLVSHRSRISRLKMNGSRLYSSSYDGKMNLWMITANSTEKVEPIPLFNANAWIMYFTQDASKQHIWTGDQKGTLTETTISIPSMANKLKDELKRDMTTEEWNYYIGQTVPYESFLQEKKGGQ